jgi:hypothetical protein
MSETETPVAERSLPDWLADDDDDAVTETAPDNADAAPSTEDSAEDESAQPSAQPRDPVTGKFAPKAEAPEAAAAPVAETLPAQPVVAPVSDAVPAQPATPSAFTYKAGGREYTIPGLAVPPEHEAEVRALLSEGMHHRTTWRQREADMRRTLDTERQSLTAEKARLDAINSELTRLLSDPDAMAEFYQNFQVEAPALQERARAAQLEARIKQYETEQENDWKRRAEEAEATGLDEQVRAAVQQNYADLFTDGDVAKMIGELQGQRIVVVADRDYPEHGYAKGDLLIDERRLLGHLAYEADQRRKAKATQAEAIKRVEKVAANNAAVLSPSAPPPVVAARSTPSPVATKKKPTSRKEWEQDLYDDDD